jgi:hypothetical protein
MHNKHDVAAWMHVTAREKGYDRLLLNGDALD